MTGAASHAWVRAGIRTAALAAFLLFLGTSFRAGWNRSTTDFPNYFTAGVLLRHGEKLHSFYDWTWFQRQMSYAGFERQLGAYTPQTPLTMVPILPLTLNPPQTAKRLWLLANIGFLAAALWLLAAMARTPIEQLALLAFCGYGSLASNFGLGQYYVFLLFLITLSVYLFRAGWGATGGFVSGVAFGLKLYTGPLGLYFLAKRKWKAAFGMAAGAVLMLLLAMAIFGWPDVQMYLTRVLPRTLEGGSVDPYNPGNATFATFLQRLFVMEPQLNPQPLVDASWLFFATRTALRLCLTAAVVLGAAFNREPEADDGLIAWFLVTLVLLSVSTASYTFILLLAPAALAWPAASKWKRLLLAGSYILLNVPIRPAWLFPKLWLLFLLFFTIGLPYLRSIPTRWGAGSIVLGMLLAGIVASREVRVSAQEPTHRYLQVGTDSHAMLSSSPAISRFGLFYECMGSFTGPAEERYVLCWSHDGRTERVPFPGHAFHPTAGPDGSIWFELVEGRNSRLARFDPTTRIVTYPLAAPRRAEGEVLSPDGRWAAFTRGPAGARELWVRSVTIDRARKIAGGRCDNGEPAWELDSSAIVFASDCGRAYGLPALYRAPVE
jgi:hypothetical protein